METLALKKNVVDVMGRLQLLYERKAEDRILASFQVPSAALEAFRRSYPPDYDRYPDPAGRIEFWDRLLAERSGLEDDSVPSVYLTEMDQGLYGGLIGGEVRFMCHHETGWISSMVKPILAELSEFKAVAVDENHPWFRRFLNQLAVFVEKSRGRFGVSHLIVADGLNFVFELVGATNTYLGLIDSPDLVRRAIDFAFEVNLKVQRAFFAHNPLFKGGTFSNMAQWLPGRIVSESIDPFHMTSVDYFETWGREWVERILGSFDGGVIHIHGNGRHLLEAARSIRGLKAIKMADDLRITPAFDLIADFKRRVKDVPLIVEAEFGPFVERLERGDLPGGVFYQVQGAPDAAAANRVMEKVRSYRA
jgi:hypothetical protein